MEVNVEAEFHKRIRALIGKGLQGKLMGAFRDAMAVHLQEVKLIEEDRDMLRLEKNSLEKLIERLTDDNNVIEEKLNGYDHALTLTEERCKKLEDKLREQNT